MAANDLVTYAQALNWLGLTSDVDVVVAPLITSMSSAIQNWLGYNIASATYTNNFNGDGGRALIVPDRPLTNVASVLLNGAINVPLQNLPLTHGFSWNDCAIYLSGHYRFPRGFQNIAVTYTAGYATVPSDIQQACLDWIKIELTNRQFDANVELMRAGDSEWRRNVRDTSIPAAIATLLQPYRLVF